MVCVEKQLLPEIKAKTFLTINFRESTEHSNVVMFDVVSAIRYNFIP